VVCTPHLALKGLTGYKTGKSKSGKVVTIPSGYTGKKTLISAN